MKPFKAIVFSILSTFLIISCCSDKTERKEIWKNEVMQAELDFAEMAKNEGIPKAFESFAAEDAVLMRNNELILGRKEIKNLYKNGVPSNVSLVWKPEFIDVASSGDLAYTYGYFTYTSTDSTGHKTNNEGVFHTVWKRQEDGSWKYVWD